MLPGRGENSDGAKADETQLIIGQKRTRNGSINGQGVLEPLRFTVKHSPGFCNHEAPTLQRLGVRPGPTYGRVLEVDGRGSNFKGSAGRKVNTVQKYVQREKIRDKAVIQQEGVREGGGGIGWSTLNFAACCSSSL